MSRRRFLAMAGTCLVEAGIANAQQQAQGGAMNKRRIASSGQELPVVGLGTWQTFDVGSAKSDRAQRAEVLKTLFEEGGSVIDSSPMYGRSEGVVGDLLEEAGTRERAFIATKVWTQGRDAGIAQMQQSMRLLRTDRIDLMQIHNLLDWKTHLPTLRGWKKDGKVRYIGVTHYTASAHDALIDAMKAEQFDFVQVNYSLDDRHAEQRLLPFARDKGIAVLINLPFGGGGLLRTLSGRALPPWATEIGCGSWAQILLKFVLANPAVTCVIPGTSRAAHMRDNAAAGRGNYPDGTLLKRMVAEMG